MALATFTAETVTGGDPSVDYFAVTPSDTQGFVAAGFATARALYVGGAGNVAVVSANGNTVTFVGVPAGSILPVMCSRVAFTGTTATNIVGLV